MAGGADQIGGPSLGSSEVYDPASGSFTPVAAMAKPRTGAAAARLSDGRVLVAGGTQTSSRHNTAELYDPATGQWAPAGVMNRYHGGGYDADQVFALPLANGRVLVGGDSQSAGATTELYNPAGPAAPTPGPSPALGPTPGTLGGVTGDPPGDAGPGAGTGTAPGNGPSATAAPVVTGFGLTNNPFVVSARSTPSSGSAVKGVRHKKGTTFRYTLSKAAMVKIVIAERRSGRRTGARCVAPTRALRHAKTCTRITGRGTLRHAGRQGANRLAFSGRIGSRALRPGRYSARLTATAENKTSKPHTVYFRIVRR